MFYDQRDFGISEGEPGQGLDTWVQARGYKDAINFITTLPEIDPSASPIGVIVLVEPNY